MRSLCEVGATCAGMDPGFCLQAKQVGGGGGRRGSNFEPNVKKPTSWAKKGPDPPMMCKATESS